MDAQLPQEDPLPMNLLDSVAPVWASLAKVHCFPQAGLEVVCRPASQLSPPGWIGVVRLGDAALITAPTPRMAEQVAVALAGLGARDVVDADAVAAALPRGVAQVLGPAALAYADAGTARPAPHPDVVRFDTVAAADPLLAVVDPADAEECGLAEMTSPLFAVCHGEALVAASAYRLFGGRLAHVGVLTAPSHRSQGLAQQVASAACAHAFDAGLPAQWRARPAASRAVARSIGFQELGAQLSFLPA